MTKTTHATAQAQGQEQLKKETWYVKLVYAHFEKEWVFSCDGVVMEELREAFLQRRPAHVKYAGTEVIVNPEHMATMEFQKQDSKPPVAK